MNLEYPQRQNETQMISPVKVELLRKSVEEVQKYELLTTNQYLKQMKLLLEILQEITQNNTKMRACF